MPARVPFVNEDRTLTREAMTFLRASREKILDITVGASPFTYKAERQSFVYLDKGTITAALLWRGGVGHPGATYVDLNPSIEMIPMSPYDELQVYYTAVPTMKFIPW